VPWRKKTSVVEQPKFASSPAVIAGLGCRIPYKKIRHVGND
jgi:hypothetical protein